MASKKNITFDIFAKDNSGKTMRGVGNNAQALGDNLRKVGMAVGIGLAAVAAGAIRVGFEAVQALQRIEVINAQTDAVIKSTGGSANITREQITAMADSLEQLTATEAESIQEGANLLLTFTNLRNGAGENEKIFDRTVESMVDMARAMGTDARGAALQLGKAINDPVRGMSELRRVGVSFTAEQQDLIRSLQESGDLFGAQGVILDALDEQFGGSGASYAATLSGQIDLLNHNMGAAAETVVAELMPHLEDAVKWMNGDGVEMLGDFADWFVDDGIPAVSGFVDWIIEYKDILGPAALAVGGLTAAQWLLNAAMAANPVGLVIMGLAALIAGAALVVTNWNAITQVIARSTGGVVNGILSLAVGVTRAIEGVINSLLAALNNVMGPINSVLGLLGLPGIRFPSSVSISAGVANFASQIQGLTLLAQGGGINAAQNYVPTGPGTAPGGGTTQFRAMAAGGIVRPTPGGIPAVIAEAGYPEAVIPLTPSALADYGLGGGGGDHYTFNIPRGSFIGTKQEFARTAVRAIEDAKKTGAVKRSALVSP